MRRSIPHAAGVCARAASGAQMYRIAQAVLRLRPTLAVGADHRVCWLVIPHGRHRCRVQAGQLVHRLITTAVPLGGRVGAAVSKAGHQPVAGAQLHQQAGGLVHWLDTAAVLAESGWGREGASLAVTKEDSPTIQMNHPTASHESFGTPNRETTATPTPTNRP